MIVICEKNGTIYINPKHVITIRVLQVDDSSLLKMELHMTSGDQISVWNAHNTINKMARSFEKAFNTV